MTDRTTDPHIETVSWPEYDIETSFMLTQHHHTLSVKFTNDTHPAAMAAVLQAHQRYFEGLADEWDGDDDD